MLIVSLSFILLNNLNYSNSFGISDSSINVKIIYPYKNDTLTNRENILVKGIATYDSGLDCSVSLIVNNKKPYYLVTPKGNNGTSDYTKWEYILDINSTKHRLIDGLNKITAKNYCLKSLSPVFDSVFFNLSSTMDSYKQRDTGDRMSNPSNANPAVASPSNATTTNVICCKNLSEDGDKDKPKHIQDTTVRLIDTDDHNYERLSLESEGSSKSLAEEIQLNIEHLYSEDSDNLDSVILDNNDGAKDRLVYENENDEFNTKDAGNYGSEGDGLHDIKSTIENALS